MIIPAVIAIPIRAVFLIGLLIFAGLCVIAGAVGWFWEQVKE